MAASFAIYLIPPPITTQLYETASEQCQSIKVIPEITIDLATNSAVTVKKDVPLQIELLRGEAYFDVYATQKSGGQLEVIVGSARIKNTGTRFSIKMQKKGGVIAVAEGQVTLQIGAQSHVIGKGRQISFNAADIVSDARITAAEIAPWRQQE